jgi:chorismate mutase
VNGLDPYRRRLDELDEQIASRLGERFAMCREIALYKRAHGIAMMQPERVAEVRSRYLARGAEVELPADFTAALFELLIGATCQMEDELIGEPEGSSGIPAKRSVATEESVAAEENRAGMTQPRFITLGPSGTCHENALRHYLEFQGLADVEIVLVEKLLDAIVQVRDRSDTFLVQCSAHLHVHLVTERYHEEVFVIDTFLYPTKALALLIRTDVQEPGSLGIVDATKGYLDLRRWDTIVDEPSKPVVARNLLAGRYDAGLTHLHHAHEHPEILRVEETYGAVDTTWVVYGPRKRFRGAVIGQRNPWLFEGEPEPAAA